MYHSVQQLTFVWNDTMLTDTDIAPPAEWWQRIADAIGACRALEDLTLCVRPPIQETSEVFSGIFSPLKLDALRRVEFVLVHDEMGPSVYTDGSYDWPAIDRLLTRARFPRLDQVKLTLASVDGQGMDMASLEAAIVDQLPALRDNGMLSIIQGSVAVAMNLD